MVVERGITEVWHESLRGKWLTKRSSCPRLTACCNLVLMGLGREIKKGSCRYGMSLSIHDCCYSSNYEAISSLTEIAIL